MPEALPVHTELNQSLALQVKHIIRPTLQAICGLTADGLEHIPEQPPYMVASTHSSMIDPFAVGVHLPDSVEMHFPAKAELRKWPLVGRLLPKIGAIYFDREDAEQGKEVGREIRSILDNNGVPILFVEATRWHGQDIAPQLRDGVTTTSRRLKVPVLPCAVGGSDKVLRRPHNPKPRHIHAEFGEVIEPLLRQTRKSKDVFQAELRGKLQELKAIANEKSGADYSRVKRPIVNKAS